MDLLHAQVPPALAALGWVLLAPCVALALATVRREFLRGTARQHAWLAGVVAIALLWLVPVRVGDGAAFGMLGVALFVLVFGAARGLLGLLAALALHGLLSDAPWSALGLKGLLFAVLPALLAFTLQGALARLLPKNVFVFIIGNGLFVTLATTAATSVAALLAALALAEAATGANLGQYLAYALLLAWGEALASGMLFSALVIYAPQIVLTYRQDLYLPLRGSRGS